MSCSSGTPRTRGTDGRRIRPSTFPQHRFAAIPDALDPVDELMTKLADRGFPPSVVELAKLGTDHHLCVPWMQATYIVVANKQALEHLPRRRAPRQLTYEHLAQWGANIEQATGERELGFPAGPKGVGRVRPRWLAWARFAQAAG